MSRVLITGGAGFLGSHLCDLFLSRGHEVICMDNLIAGNIENIYHAASPFNRDPRCVKQYRIEAMEENGSWHTIEAVDNNYQRRRTHTLTHTITTRSLRIMCEETWGEPSAALYEVRIYT